MMIPRRAGSARSVAVTFLLLATAPSAAGAQADSIGRVLASLASDRPVRVQLRSPADVGETLSGPIVSRAGRRFDIAASGEVRTVGYEEVRRLWIEEGRLGGRGAWTGALIGGGAGALLGVVGAATDDTGEIAGEALVLAFGASGALAGGLVGYVIGHHRRDWELRFEAAPERVGLRVSLPLE